MSDKSIWWSVTAWTDPSGNWDDIALCEGELPEFVRAIYGGREECPETGRLHFQGAVQCYQQQRMAKLKTWLKHTKLQPARSEEALKKYVMKAETAVGPKTIRENPIRHVLAHDMCLLLARQTDSQTTGFWTRVNMILDKSPELAGQLMNPSLRNFYEKTELVWLRKAAIVLQQPCSCRKDECEECAEQELISHA